MNKIKFIKSKYLEQDFTCIQKKIQKDSFFKKKITSDRLHRISGFRKYSTYTSKKLITAQDEMMDIRNCLHDQTINTLE